MPPAFVTGVTRQDGGYLVERLRADSVGVHGLVRGTGAQARMRETYPAITVHVGDLRDCGSVAHVTAAIEPHEVYNLGGISSVAASWRQPVETGQVSGVAVACLLTACWDLCQRIGRPVRVVQASSAEIFGNPARSPQDETTPIAPITPYGAAKAYAHHMIGVYRARGLHAASVVLYNHESPRRPTRFVTRKITSGAAQIARGEQVELAMGNLDARRDWGWAPDYVDAMIRAVRRDDPDDYVIAAGASHSVREFVAAAFRHAGLDDWQRYVRIDQTLVRPVDAADLTGDPGPPVARLGADRRVRRTGRPDADLHRAESGGE